MTINLQDKINQKRAEYEAAGGTIQEPEPKCSCGECDGAIGMYVDGDNRAKYCPNYLRNYQRVEIHREMKKWHGWPPPTFEDIRTSALIKNTESFNAVASLFGNIRRREPPGGVILYGGYGRGKTLAGLTLILELAEIGIRSTAVDFPELVEMRKRGILGNDYVDRVYFSIKNSAFVLLDDINRETKMGDPNIAMNLLDDIVSMCFRKRFLLVTTNLETKEKIKDYIPARSMSMLSKDIGYCQTIQDEGENLRHTML